MTVVDALPGLREAVFHLEAAAALLRDVSRDGFEIHVREIIQDGRPLVETVKVRFLTVSEQAKNFGSVPGTSTTHLWREVWSGPVA